MIEPSFRWAFPVHEALIQSNSAGPIARPTCTTSGLYEIEPRCFFGISDESAFSVTTPATADPPSTDFKSPILVPSSISWKLPTTAVRSGISGASFRNVDASWDIARATPYRGGCPSRYDVMPVYDSPQWLRAARHARPAPPRSGEALALK